MSGSDEARARNEKLKSYVNDRIADINDRLDESTRISDWICECSDASCSDHLTASARDYEDVRTHPRRFLVLPGHADAELEQIVGDRGDYMVVEKVGKAGKASHRD